MKQLEHQLHGHESTTHTRGGPIRRSPGHPSHASEQYTLAGVGLCTNHLIILATKPNHQDMVARGTTTQAILYNMIGEL
jgi:hypothetical protein